VQAASATTRRFMGSRPPAVPGARHISPARTTSRRPRFQQTVGRATDHRTVPTDRRWFVRHRGLVGTHPTAENLDRSSETSGAPLSLLVRSPVRRRRILEPTLSARSLSTSLTKISSAQRADAYYQQINTKQHEHRGTAMRLIVVRAVPSSTTQQGRRHRRPDSFDVGTTERTSRRRMGHESKEAGP
jgi:hypothetical protein